MNETIDIITECLCGCKQVFIQRKVAPAKAIVEALLLDAIEARFPVGDPGFRMRVRPADNAPRMLQ